MSQAFDISFRNVSTGVVCVCSVVTAPASADGFSFKVSIRHPRGLPQSIADGHLRIWHEWLGGVGKNPPGVSYPIPSGWAML